MSLGSVALAVASTTAGAFAPGALAHFNSTYELNGTPATWTAGVSAAIALDTATGV